LISDIGLGFVQYRNDFDNSIMNGPISEWETFLQHKFFPISD
jgi:hypothetical protein